ncbi:MAG: hypothetical protein U5O39_07050 [Gammaproteobacteria bacterium]|nr:hypothetical protein [Gammaproteobacteria bacterium]
MREPPAYEGEYLFSELGPYLADCVTAGRLQGVVLMLGYQGKAVYTIRLGNLMPTSKVPRVGQQVDHGGRDRRVGATWGGRS